jgi:hypothetical protein
MKNCVFILSALILTTTPAFARLDGPSDYLEAKRDAAAAAAVAAETAAAAQAAATPQAPSAQIAAVLENPVAGRLMPYDLGANTYYLEIHAVEKKGAPTRYQVIQVTPVPAWVGKTNRPNMYKAILVDHPVTYDQLKVIADRQHSSVVTELVQAIDKGKKMSTRSGTIGAALAEDAQVALSWSPPESTQDGLGPQPASTNTMSTQQDSKAVQEQTPAITSPNAQDQSDPHPTHSGKALIW